MKNGGPTVVVLILLFAWTLNSCGEASNKDSVRVTAGPVDLNNIVTILPDAPGAADFQRNCLSCHSARYIQMQPNFSEKTWLSLVTKMQKSFGAPVPDSSVKSIVQYLVAIKGKS